MARNSTPLVEGSVTFRFTHNKGQWEFAAAHPETGYKNTVLLRCPGGKETASKVARTFDNCFQRNKTLHHGPTRSNIARMLEAAANAS